MIIKNSVIFRNIVWKDYPALERFIDAFTVGSRTQKKSPTAFKPALPL